MLGKSFRSSHLRTQTGHKNSNKHQEKMLQARNKYIYEPKIYEDPYLVDIMSFLRDCCHLFFLLFFLIFFVFASYPNKKTWQHVPNHLGHLCHLVFISPSQFLPPLPPSSSAARRGSVRCSRMVFYLGNPKDNARTTGPDLQ